MKYETARTLLIAALVVSIVIVVALVLQAMPDLGAELERCLSPEQT